MEWTDEKKAEVIKRYKDASPTPDTSMDVVKEIAEDVEATPNGVRMILSKAGVYVKATPAPAKTKDKTSSDDKAPKVSKGEKIDKLRSAIEAAGLTADEEILDKLTGKAAEYFYQVVSALVNALEQPAD
jgi:predicted transcriptional regulator